MRTQPCERCVACGGTGPVLHAGVTDRLFRVDGQWNERVCLQCGSLWLDPQPVPAEIHLAYRRYYTHDHEREEPERRQLGDLLASGSETLATAYVRCRYGGSHSLKNLLLGLPVRMWAGRRADASFGAFFRPIRPGARVLDLGAGRGEAVARLQRLGWRAEGIDIDEAAVVVARRAGLPVRTGDLWSQRYPDETFDLLVMSHTIEHVHDPRSLLAECARVLTRDGEVAIVTPNAQSWLHRRWGRDWMNLDPPRHLQVFSRTGLAQVLTSAGMPPRTITTSVRGANVVAEAWLAFQRKADFDMTIRPPWRDRVIAELVQQLEAARLVFDKDAGEDLVAIAGKP